MDSGGGAGPDVESRSGGWEVTIEDAGANSDSVAVEIDVRRVRGEKRDLTLERRGSELRKLASIGYQHVWESELHEIFRIKMILIVLRTQVQSDQPIGLGG